MKSKLFLFCFSLFICSLTLNPSEYLSVVPSTTSEGTSAEYTFKFATSLNIPDHGSIVIQFPNEILDFGSLPDCLVSQNGAPAAKVACQRNFLGEYTNVEFALGQVGAQSYVITIPGIRNPVNVTSSGNFRVYTKKYQQVVEDSWDFQGIAFSKKPESLVSAVLTHLPPTLMRAPNKFQWQIKTQFDYPAGQTLRFILPAGFNALRPICEVVQEVNSVETITTLFFHTSATNQVVDCLNIPFALEKNTLYKFNLDSVMGPEYAGSFSGFTVQIVNGKFPQTLESSTNNAILTILPQPLTVGPASLDLHKRQVTNLTVQLDLAHEIAHPSQIVVSFTNGWTLPQTCQVVSGLESNGNGPVTCLKDGANLNYFVSNFQKASPGTPIVLSFAVTTPEVGNVVYDVTFTTWDLSLGGVINQGVLPVQILTSSGDAELFKFYAFSSKTKFLAADTKSLHFAFQLDYSWPGTSTDSLLTVDILPKIPDQPANIQLGCEINGYSTTCSIDNSNEDRTVVVITRVTGKEFTFLYLVISGTDTTTNQNAGLQWPHEVNSYRAILVIKKDTTDNNAPVHFVTANFSNTPVYFTDASLTSLVGNSGQLSPLKLSFTSPVHLANNRDYALFISLNSDKIYGQISEEGQVDIPCLISSDDAPFCLLSNQGGKPLITVHGLTTALGQNVDIVFSKILLADSTDSASNSYEIWIEELAPGRFGHLLENFNLTYSYVHSQQQSLAAFSPAHTVVEEFTHTVDNAQVGLSTQNVISFKVKTSNPDYIVFTFQDGLQVLQTKTDGSLQYFGGLGNQIIHYSPDASNAEFTETLTIPINHLRNPSEGGDKNVVANVVKNGNVVESYNLKLTVTYAPSGSQATPLELTGIFGPMTPVVQNANTLFQSIISGTNNLIIPQGSCINLYFAGNELADEGKITTCSANLGALSCKVMNSSYVQVSGINADIDVTAAPIVVVNNFKALTSNGVAADFVVSFASDCSDSSVSVNVPVTSFNFETNKKAGTFNVGGEYDTILYSGAKQALKLNVDFGTNTQIVSVTIAPQCVSANTPLLSTFIGGVAYPHTFPSNGPPQDFEVKIAVGAVLSGQHEIVINDEFGNNGGLTFTCTTPGQISSTLVSIETDTETYSFKHYFRVAVGNGNVKKLTASRLVNHENFDSGALKLTFALTTDLNPSIVKFQLVSNGLAPAFDPALTSTKSADNEITCAVDGLTSTGPMKCFVTTHQGIPVIELSQNFAALTTNADVEVTIFNVKNLAAVAKNTYELHLQQFDATSKNLLTHHVEVIADTIATSTYPTEAETYTTPLGFAATEAFGSVNSLNIQITPTIDYSANSRIVVFLPSEIQTTNALDCAPNLCLAAQGGKIYVIHVAALTANTPLTLALTGVSIFGSTLKDDITIETILFKDDGTIGNHRTHAYLAATSLSLVKPLTVAFKPYNADLATENENFHFPHNKQGIWASLEFDLVHGISVGGSIVISATETNYVFHPNCFSNIAEGSDLQSALSSSDIYCEANGNNLVVSVDKVVAAGDTLKLLINFDSVGYVPTYTFSVTTYESYDSAYPDAHKLDSGSVTGSRVADGKNNLNVDISQTYSIDTYLEINARKPFLLSIDLVQAIASATGSLTLTFPASNINGQGDGFVFGTTSYICHAKQSVEINCNVVVDANAKTAVLTFEEDLSVGLIDLELSGYDSDSTTIGILYPSTPGLYSVGVLLADTGSSYSDSASINLNLAGPSFTIFTLENIIPAFQANTGLIVTFSSDEDINEGKIVLNLYLKGVPYESNYHFENFDGKAVDFTQGSNSNLQECFYYSGSNNGTLEGIHNERFECIVGTTIVADTEYSITLYTTNPEITLFVPPYNFALPATLSYLPDSGTGTKTSISKSSYGLTSVTTEDAPAPPVNFYKTVDGTDPAETGESIFISVANICGSDLADGDSIIITFESLPLTQTAAFVVTGNAAVTPISNLKGFHIKATGAVAAAGVQFGPFSLQNGHDINGIPAYTLSCSLSTGKNIFNQIAVPGTNIAVASALSSFNLVVTPTSNVKSASTNLNITFTVVNPGVKKIVLDLTNLYTIADGEKCVEMEESDAIQSCAIIAGNKLVVILPEKTNSTTPPNIKIRTVNSPTSNPSDSLVNAAYTVILSALETGNEDYVAVPITAGVIAQKDDLQVSVALVDADTDPALSLKPIYNKYSWSQDLTQNYPNRAFVSFGLKLDLASGFDLNVKFTENLYNFQNVNNNNYGVYEGALVCLVGGEAHQCSANSTDLSISGLPALTVGTEVLVHVGYFVNELKPALVTASQFETLSLTFSKTGETDVVKESDYFHTYPNVLKGVTIKPLTTAANALNYLEFNISDVNTVTSPDTYKVVIELINFATDSLGTNGLYDSAANGFAVPCVNLNNTGKAIRCVFVSGTTAKIVVEVDSSSRSDLHFGLTGITNPAEETDAIFTVSVYNGAGSLVGIERQTLFKTGLDADFTASDITVAFGDNYNVKKDYTLGGSSFNFNADHKLIYVVHQTESKFVFDYSAGRLLSGVDAGGNVVNYLIVTLSGVSDSATLDTQAFYLSSQPTGTISTNVFHYKIDTPGTPAALVTKLSFQAASFTTFTGFDFGVPADTAIGTFTTSVSKTGTAFDDIYLKIKLDLSGLSSYLINHQIQRGAFARLQLPSSFAGFSSGNCWVDGNIFVSNDPLNPPTCSIESIGNDGIGVKIENFDSIALVNGGNILLKDSGITLSTTQTAEAAHFYINSHDESDLAKPFVDIQTTILNNLDTYSADDIGVDHISQVQFGKINGTAIKFSGKLKTTGQTAPFTIKQFNLTVDSTMPIGVSTFATFKLLPTFSTAIPCLQSDSVFKCNLPDYEITTFTSEENTFELVINYASTFNVPDSLPFYFFKVDVTYSGAPDVVEHYQNIAALFDPNYQFPLNSGISTSSNFVQWSHRSGGHWGMLNVSVVTSKVSVNTNYPLALQLHGASSEKYTNGQEIACRYSLGFGKCYILKSGGLFTKDTILIVPTASIPAGSTFTISILLDNAAAGHYTKYSLYSVHKDNNLDIDWGLASKARQEQDDAIYKVTDTVNLGGYNGNNLELVYSAFEQNQWISVAFNKLTVNQSHTTFASEISKYSDGTDDNKQFKSAILFNTGSTFVFFGQLATTETQVAFKFTELLNIKGLDGADGSIQVGISESGATTHKTHTITVSTPAKGQLAGTITQLYGKQKKNFNHFYKYSFNVGIFDVHSSGTIEIVNSDIQKTADQKCAAYSGSQVLACNFVLATNKYTIVPTSGQIIPGNTTVDLLIDGHISADESTELHDIVVKSQVPEDNTIRYEELFVQNKLTLSGGDNHVVGQTEVIKQADKAAFEVENSHVFDFVGPTTAVEKIHITLSAEIDLTAGGQLWCEISEVVGSAFTVFSPAISSQAVACAKDGTTAAQINLDDNIAVSSGKHYRVIVTVVDLNVGYYLFTANYTDNITVTADYSNTVLTSLVLLDSGDATVGKASRGPVYPIAHSPHKVYINSKEASADKTVVFKILAPAYRAFGHIQVDFLNKPGCSSCQWKTDSDLFSSSSSNGDEIDCFAGLLVASQDSNVYNNFGPRVKCYHYFGSGNPSVKIYNVGNLAENDELTLVLYGLQTQSNNLPLQVTFVEHDNADNKVLHQIQFSSLFTPLEDVASPAAVTAAWSRVGASQNVYGDLSAESSINLEVASDLQLNAGDIITVKLPTTLAFNAQNFFSANFELGGNALSVVFKDQSRLLYFLSANSAHTLTSTSADVTVKNIDHPLNIVGCNSCDLNSEIHVFNGFQQNIEIASLVYPTLDSQQIANSTSVYPTNPALGSLGTLSFNFTLPQAYGSGITAKIFSHSYDIVFVECKNASSNNHAVGCNARKVDNDSSWVSVFDVEAQYFALDVMVAFNADNEHEFTVELQQNGQTIYYNDTHKINIAYQTATTQQLSVYIPGKFVIGDYLISKNQLTENVLASSKLVFALTAPYDFNSSASAFTITTDGDYFSLGTYTLRCYVQLFGVKREFLRTLGTTCSQVEDTGKRIITVEKPTFQFPAGLYFEIIVEKDLPPNDANINFVLGSTSTYKFIRFNMDNTFSFFYGLIHPQQQPAVFKEFAASHASLNANTANFIDFTVKSGIALQNFIATGRFGYIEFEFNNKRFPSQIAADAVSNHVYFSANAACGQGTDSVIYLPGGNGVNSRLRLLNGDISADTAINYLAPLILNGDLGKTVDIKISYYEAQAASGYVPVPIVCFRFEHQKFSNAPAASTNAGAVATSAPALYDASINLALNFVPTPTLLAASNPHLLVKASRNTHTDFCNIDFVDFTGTKYYAGVNFGFWLLSVGTDITTDPTPINANAYKVGISNTQFSINSFSQGAVVHSYTYDELVTSTNAIALALSNTNEQNSNDVNENTLTFSAASSFNAETHINIDFHNLTHTDANVMGGFQCEIVSGLSGVGDGVPQCTQTANGYQIVGFDDVAGAANVVVKVYSKIQPAESYGYEVSVYQGTDRLYNGSATQTISKVSNLRVLSSNYFRTKARLVNNHYGSLLFSYSTFGNEFENQNAVNTLHISGLNPLLRGSDNIKAYIKENNNWVPIDSSLDTNDIVINLAGFPLNQGTTYHFKINTDINDGNAGIQFNLNKILNPMQLLAKQDGTLVEETISNFVIVGDSSIVTTANLNTLINAKDTVGLSIATFEFTIGLLSNDVITLQFPNSNYLNQAIWDSNLGISGTNVPCERYFGETHISANAISCTLTQQNGLPTIEISQLTSNIAPDQEFKVLFYGIKTPNNEHAPIRVSVKRMEQDFLSNGCKIIDFNQILNFPEDAHVWSYTADAAVTTATPNTVGSPSTHAFDVNGSNQSGDFYVLFYPSELLSIGAQTPPANSLATPLSNSGIVVYILSGAVPTLEIDGTNNPGIDLDPPHPRYQHYQIGSSTYTGFEINPVVLVAASGAAISVRELSFNTLDLTNGKILKDHINPLHIVVTDAWTIGETTHLIVAGTGLSGFVGNCNATLGIDSQLTTTNLPSGLECEISADKSFVNITLAKYFQSTVVSVFPANTKADLRLFISVETNEVTETSLDLSVKAFVSSESYSHEFVSSTNFAEVSHPAIYTFNLGGILAVTSPIDRLQFVYQPYSTDEITKATISLPDNFKPLPDNLLNLQCSFYTDDDDYIKPCSLNENSQLSLEFEAFTQKAFVVEIVNLNGDLFVQPESVAYNNMVRIETKNDDNLVIEHDYDKTPGLCRGRLQNLIVDVGNFHGAMTKGVFNITTGDVGITKGYSTTEDSKYSKIVISFLSAHFAPDLQTGIADGEEIGCIQLNSSVAVVSQSQPSKIKCVLYHANAGQNPRIEITGHEEIISHTSTGSIMIAPLESPNNLGNVTFTVYEYDGDYVGINIATFHAILKPRANAADVVQGGSLGSTALVMNQEKTLGEYTLDTNEQSLDYGNFLLVKFDDNLFDSTESNPNIISSDNCIKAITFPTSRVVLVLVECATTNGNVVLSNVPLQPYNLPAGAYNLDLLVFDGAQHRYLQSPITISASAALAPVVDTDYFNLEFSGLQGAQTHKNVSFTLGTPSEVSSNAQINVLFPGATQTARRILTQANQNLFGDFSITNPTCHVLTYPESICTINPTGFTVQLNNPAEFNWNTKVQVVVTNLNHPNETQPGQFFTMNYMYSVTRQDLKYAGKFLVPSFSSQALVKCQFSASSEYNNTLSSGDLRVSVSCPSGSIVKGSHLAVGVQGLSYNINPTVECIGENIFLASQTCQVVDQSNDFVTHVVVKLEEFASSSVFSVVLKNLIGLPFGTHNVTLNITSQGLRYAIDEEVSIISTNETKSQLDVLAITPQLILTNNNPTGNSDYLFAINHDTRTSAVTTVKILFDQKHYQGSLHGSTCVIGALTQTFDLSSYYANTSILSPIDCSVISGGVRVSNFNSSYMATNLLVIGILNVVNPTKRLIANFKYELAEADTNGAFLLLKKSVNHLVDANVQIKPILVNSIDASETGVALYSTHSFSINSFTEGTGTGKLEVSFDQRFGNGTTCASTFSDQNCVLNNLVAVESGNFTFSQQNDIVLTVNGVKNPETSPPCNTESNDLYNFKISKIDSATLYYRSFKALNPGRICKQYTDTRIQVALEGDKIVKAGVLNQFKVKLSEAATELMTLTPSANQDGITFLPGVLEFATGTTELTLTILSSAKSQYTYSSFTATFAQVDAGDHYAELAPITFTVDRTADLNMVTIKPLQEVKFFDVPYYFEIFIEGAPAVDLTVSISSLVAEVLISNSSVVLNANKTSAVVSLKVGSLFQGNSIVVSFGLQFPESDKYTYELAQNSMTIAVSNIQQSVLSVVSNIAQVNKTRAILAVETNQPVKATYVVLPNGSPAPNTTTIESFLSVNHKIANGTVQTIQDNFKFYANATITGLLAETSYDYYAILDNTLEKKAIKLPFETAPLESAITFTLKFSSAVDSNTVISNVSSITGIPIEQFQIGSISNSRLLQGQNPVFQNFIVVPSPNNDLNLQGLINSLNSQENKDLLAAQFPQFDPSFIIQGSQVPANVPSFSVLPSVISYSYFNATVSMTLLNDGGVFAIRVKRENKGQPNFNGNPSGIQILNKQNHLGDSVGAYDYGACATVPNSLTCTIQFDDFKSDSVYDLYVTPFAKVSYTPPPVGGANQVKHFNFTTPANPFVEKQ